MVIIAASLISNALLISVNPSSVSSLQAVLCQPPVSSPISAPVASLQPRGKDADRLVFAEFCSIAS